MKVFLLPLLFCITLYSCRKDYDDFDASKNLTLPPYTETGVGTFAYMLNDTLWTNFGAHHVSGELSGGWVDNKIGAGLFVVDTSIVHTTNIVAFGISGQFSIVKRNEVLKDLVTYFTVVPTSSITGQYTLSGKYPNDFKVIKFGNNYGGYYSIDSVKNLFQVQLVKTSPNIVSGKFQGVLYNENNSSDSIIIKDGRFDVKLN